MRTLIEKLANRPRTIEDHLTVRTQIAGAVAAMMVVLVGTLATGAAFVGYQNTASLINNGLASIASDTADRLDRFMAVRQQEISLFSQLQLQKLWNDPRDLRRALEQLQQTFTDFAWIGFADPNGKVVASTGGLLEGTSISARPWFKEGLQRIAFGDVHEAVLLASLLAQRPGAEPYRVVDIAVPVRNSEGELKGVLGSHLNWDWASSLIQGSREQ